MSLQDEAEDRRPDLGWLLCTLGRHGPALLLVLVLVLVVGAGVCVYRAVTGRRRGAPARGGTPPGGGRRPGEDTGKRDRRGRCEVWGIGGGAG